MKPIATLTLALCIALSLNAQILHPVKWAYAAKKTGKNEAVILIKAMIDDGWHIYSAYQKPGGPLKTSFEFTAGADFDIVGNIAEPVPLSRFEKVFNMNVNYFENEVVFQQKVRLKGNVVPVFILGNVSFMCCNDQKCLAPETVNFTIPVK